MPGGYRRTLKVFISSTIVECSRERQLAEQAIESLGHSAFRFEAEGARPYPPRSLYLPMLRDSNIFVGIYRKEYGWVAPDMTISGLEGRATNCD